MADGSPRILLIRLSAVGDCVHALPVLAALRDEYPEAFIGWAIEAGPYELLRSHPYVDRFHLYPRDAFRRKGTPLLKRMNALSSFRRELMSAHYDIVVDLQGLTKSGLVAWWSRAPRRLGFRGVDSRELNAVFLNERTPIPQKTLHVVERNLVLLGPLGVAGPVRPRWVFPDYSRERQTTDAFLRECGLLKKKTSASHKETAAGPSAAAGGVEICAVSDKDEVEPFAVVNTGGTWPTKKWSAERFALVARGLVERYGVPVVATWGSEEERREAEAVAAKAGAAAFTAPKTNLRKLATLLTRAGLFVGNDTGPLHLAAALNVPTVAVFGATDHLRNGPYGARRRVCCADGVECRPCWKRTCERKSTVCLETVTAETVLESCATVLNLV